jgi:hypothetical protein
MFGRIAGAALAAFMLAACGNGSDGARSVHEREGDFTKGRADAPVPPGRGGVLAYSPSISSRKAASRRK